MPRFPQTEVNPTERKAVDEAAANAARGELGDAATIDRLLQDLAVEERLDAMIDKCLKRLLYLRGLKSLPTAFFLQRPRAPQSRSSSRGRRKPHHSRPMRYGHSAQAQTLAKMSQGFRSLV